MNSRVTTIVKQNLDFVKINTHINLDFVYLQMDNITKLVGNEDFAADLKDLIDQILDRDDNGVFDSNDVKLLKQIFTKKQTQVLNIYNFIMEIFNAVLALIAKMEKSVLKYDKEAIEGVFFGVFSYVLFQYGTMKEEDKLVILDILVAIYSTLETVDNTLGVTKKLLDLLKKKGWCKCLYTNDTTDASPKLEKEIMRSRERVKELAVTMKETERLHNKVDNLEKQLNATRRQPNAGMSVSPWSFSTIEVDTNLRPEGVRKPVDKSCCDPKDGCPCDPEDNTCCDSKDNTCCDPKDECPCDPKEDCCDQKTGCCEPENSCPCTPKETISVVEDSN